VKNITNYPNYHQKSEYSDFALDQNNILSSGFVNGQVPGQMTCT
jgi:hypothetical protein